MTKKQLPEQPDVKKLRGFTNDKSQREPVKKFSVFNQARYIFERQDAFLTRCHQLHDAALTYNSDGQFLYSCLSAFKHAYLPTKYALTKGDRQVISRKLERVTKMFKESFKPGEGFTQEDYTKIHSMLYQLLDFLYLGQQRAKMNLPMESFIDDETKLGEVMED